MADYVGTSGDDDFTGTSDFDTFDLSQGGRDTASGGDSSDIFNMGKKFDAHDRIDGGNFSDTVNLSGGDYNITFRPTTMVNVEFLQLLSNNNYTFITDDATVAAFSQLNVSATALDAAHALVFDGSAETDGRFQIEAGAGDDVLTGGAAGNFLSGGAGNDVLTGGAANDTLLGGDGQNTLSAGAGDDTIYSSGHDSIDGGADDDLLYLQLSSSNTDLTLHIVDTATPATLIGQGTTVVGIERFWVETGSGNDDIALGAGGDRLIGGGGNNTLHGGGGDDVIQEDNQYDTNTANALYGDAGNDSLHGSHGGTNLLDGGDGNDQIFSLARDKIVGGKGSDTATIDRNQSFANITFHMMDASSVTKMLGDGTTVTGVETVNIFTGYGNDDITTLDGNDTIRAGYGDNTVHSGGGSDAVYVTGDGANLLDGGAGNDQLFGGQGANTLLGGDGDDTIFSYGVSSIDGGDGVDTLYFNYNAFGPSTPLTIHFVSASDVTTIAGNGTTFTGMENLNLYGGSGDDRFVTGDGHDFLSGVQGNNVLKGGGGDDMISVQSMSGTNTLDGGDGNDTLIGGTAAGTLRGGNGNDYLNSYSSDAIFGGVGDDHVFAYGNAHIVGGAGDDQISLQQPPSPASTVGMVQTLSLFPASIHRRT